MAVRARVLVTNHRVQRVTGSKFLLGLDAEATRSMDFCGCVVCYPLDMGESSWRYLCRGSLGDVVVD